MATCPACGQSSRAEPGLMTVEFVLVASPIGSFSLAGAQDKVSATSAAMLSCRCGWSVIGYINGDEFVVDEELTARAAATTTTTPREPIRD